MENGKVFCYTHDDLVKEPVLWKDIGQDLTSFDRTLRRVWDTAVDDGLFRYTLNDCVYKKLDLQVGEGCKLPCVAQLNPQRAANRRKRECFESINDEFDEKQFNFTKIRENEILMEITQDKSNNEDAMMQKHKILLNISPIEYGHVLFVPFLEACLPQRLTKESLLLAYDVLQLSSQPSFRLSLNSLHAWASINHLHFHGMHCEHEIFGDILPAEENLIGSCYLLDTSSPLPAFVFTVPDDVPMRNKIAKDVVTITDYLHSVEVPYNVLLNRGRIVSQDGTTSHNWTTRTIVFPRKSSKGLVPADPFDVACIEVGGHFPVKTRESFDALTPEIALDALKTACLDKHTFDNIASSVKCLFLNEEFAP